jgi:argininosuccinate lyase
MKRWNSDYQKHVLEPHFLYAKRYFFKPMLTVSRAHALMLCSCGLLSQEHMQKILAALEIVKFEKFTYSSRFEDLFFALEARLSELAGSEAAGNLHIARSRNDLDAALIRMVLRQQTLETHKRLHLLASTLQQKAVEGLGWLMPGYTHHQPAQPTTLAHYLCGVLNAVQRDLGRLEAAYHTINRSPLGVAAMTGTGFAINRQMPSDWLGFEGLLENGIDAVGAADQTLELLASVQIASNTLSRLTHDLVFWASQELGFFRVGDEFVQISSIMPQKRNPVVLEHIRAKLNRASGAVGSAFAQTCNIPFGDVNDVAEPLLPVVLVGLRDFRASCELLCAVLCHSSFQRQRMEYAAGAHFITATGLADALVGLGMPFRIAHQIASKTVDLSLERAVVPSASLVQEAAKRHLPITDGWVQRALDPLAFVESRTGTGGSAPSAVQSALESAAKILAQAKTWRIAQDKRLKTAQHQLERVKPESL